jgi:hypothetical protein
VTTGGGHILEKGLLWLGVATFGGFGVVFLFAFDTLAAKLGIVTGNTGRIDLLAMYVGFEIGFAIFLAYCALRPERLRLGLVASGLAFAGFGAARAGGLAVHGDGAATFLYYLLAAEAAGTALSFWAASRVKAPISGARP